jgi:polyribonucleotide nucleotidyltransferase
MPFSRIQSALTKNSYESFQIVQDAMEKGSFGICKILDIMERCQAEPKSGKSNWPVSEKLSIPITKRGKFMGPGNEIQNMNSRHLQFPGKHSSLILLI